jgi:hypothetical protein
MIHHDCTHAGEDREPFVSVSGTQERATIVKMGYGGSYRCAECKRRVDIGEIDGETWRRDMLMQGRVEPPYPNGTCGTACVGG